MDDDKANMAMSLGDKAVLIGVLQLLVEKKIATGDEIADMIERRCARSMDLIEEDNEQEIEQEMGRYLAAMADSFRS